MLATMTTQDHLGAQILVYHYDFITLFRACKFPAGERERNLTRLDEYCRVVAGERRYFEPEIGQIVGVFLPIEDKWVRGKIDECILRSQFREYRVLLVDRGDFLQTQLKHLVEISKSMMSWPEASKRVGLYGVIPKVHLNQETRRFLYVSIHSNLYFKKKVVIGSILFGDIFIWQESDGKVISLTNLLLEKDMVIKVDNFETEARKFYSSILGVEEGSEEVEEATSVSSPNQILCSKGNGEIMSSQYSTRNNEKEEKDERRIHSKDTGYSSSDDSSSDGPFVREDAVMVPVGFHFTDQKPKKSRNKENEEVKCIKTYFQIKREKEQQAQKCAKTKKTTSSKEKTKSKDVNESEIGNKERYEKQKVNQNKTVSSEKEMDKNCTYQSVFQRKTVSFGEEKCEENKNCTSSEGKEEKLRSRAFDLNYKSKVESPEKNISETDEKQKISFCCSERSKETNICNKEAKREDFDSSKKLNVSFHSNSSVNSSFETSPNSSMVTNDSKISNESLHLLTKKQRLSLKLKAGIAALEIVNTVTQEKDEESISNSSSSNPNGTEAISIPIHSSSSLIVGLGNQNASENDGAMSTSSEQTVIKSRVLLSNGQLCSHKVEAKEQSRQLPSPDTKDLDMVGDNDRRCNSSSITQAERQENSNENTRVDTEDVKCNSLKEKRRRIRERLRKKEESDFETDSETSLRELSASCSQSICSEDSFVRKTTLDNIINVPIEESKDSENNLDYVEVEGSPTFLRCIHTSTGVLVHTKDGRIIRPALTLSDCYLDGSIIQTLEQRGMREMNRIQKFSYPTILARRSIAMISPRRSGKTCGYVVPISSLLLNQHFYASLPKGNGPRALVITPCWESGAFAATEFKNTLKSLNVIHCYGGGAELELKLPLLEGCDVLVTTPRCVLRLLSCQLTNLLRLCHLVMDDADVLFDKFKPEMQKLMVEADGAEEVRESRGAIVPLQVVLAARMWTPPIQEMVTRILTDPTVCIASQLEACVYAGVKPTAVFVPNDKKIEKLVDVLKEVEGKLRTVVMCSSKDDVKHLHKVLMDLGVDNVIAAHEGFSGVSISEVPMMWNKPPECASEKIWNQSSSMPIMIRSDEVLEDVPITNANVLIHYNMSNSKKTFSLRFISLMENYHNVVKKESPNQKPQVVILLDEKNDLEVPGVMEFMERLGTVLPEPVLNTLEQIKKMNDQKRMSEPLCEAVKEFGECSDVKSCPYRHFVSAELDSPCDIPRTGWVKLIVQHIHDACHYSARLLEHAEKKGEWRKMQSNFLVLPLKLNNYYAKESNKRLHGHPEVGDLVALETSAGVFQRAVVLKIVEYNKRNEPVRVQFRLVDNGRYDFALVSRMWYLPPDLAAPPPSVVDVYLCGLRPRDLDISWPPAPGAWVDQRLRQLRRDNPDGYMVGKITLSLKGNLWLEPVEYLEFLPGMDTTVFLLDLRKGLLQTNNATENKNHIPALCRLCEEAGIDLPPGEKVQFKKPQQARPQWAFLPQDRYETVHIVVVQDPEAIFLRCNYFVDCLQKLVVEIQQYASTQKKNFDCKHLLALGDVCLGKPSGTDEWNRAVVKSRPDEDTVELFFVDYGDTEVVPWGQVMPISNKLITKLPFQVIECCLAGVKFQPPEANDEDWEEEVIDMIYNLSRNENEEALSLMVKVCSIETKAKYTSGKRYKVVLADCSMEPATTINSKLISSPFAMPVEEEIVPETLEIPKTVPFTMPVEEEIVLENLEIPKTVDDGQSSQCEEEIPPSSNLEVVPTYRGLDLVLPEMKAKLSETENNNKVMQFLKEFEEGDFDCSIFHGVEEDADVSDNASEGSVSSLPRPGGCLPRTSRALRPLPPPKAEDSSSAASPSLSSSQNSSTLSLNVEKYKNEIKQSEPLASSSPNTTPSYVKKESFSSDTSSSLRITGIAHNFRDLISPSLLGSNGPSLNSERCSPFLRRVTPTAFDSDIDDLGDGFEDNEMDSTVFEMNNLSSKINISEKRSCTVTEIELNQSSFTHIEPVSNEISNKESFCTFEPQQDSHFQLSEAKSDFKEVSEENKSPCQKWVECVIPDSDEDLSLLQNSVGTNLEEPNKIEIRTPLVEWHQDDSFVYLHIKLPALTKYKFSCDDTSLHFSAEYEGVPYIVNLPKLCGGHKSETARTTSKACFFEIRLEKLVKGKRSNWPRLTERDDKFHWLKLNAEKACEDMANSEDEGDEDVKRLACSLPLWNDHPTDSNSVASSDRSELAYSELSN